MTAIGREAAHSLVVGERIPFRGSNQEKSTAERLTAAMGEAFHAPWPRRGKQRGGDGKRIQVIACGMLALLRAKLMAEFVKENWETKVSQLRIMQKLQERVHIFEKRGSRGGALVKVTQSALGNRQIPG